MVCGFLNRNTSRFCETNGDLLLLCVQFFPLLYHLGCPLDEGIDSILEYKVYHGPMKREHMQTYTIGQLARAMTLNIQTIRYYERQGILKPMLRRESGYRIYSDDSLKCLSFIRQAKKLGFNLKEIRELLDLKIQSPGRCNKVRKKAEEKLNEIQVKMADLRLLEQSLKILIMDCKNRVVSDFCPILSKMEECRG